MVSTKTKAKDKKEKEEMIDEKRLIKVIKTSLASGPVGLDLDSMVYGLPHYERKGVPLPDKIIARYRLSLDTLKKVAKDYTFEGEIK